MILPPAIKVLKGLILHLGGVTRPVILSQVLLCSSNYWETGLVRVRPVAQRGSWTGKNRLYRRGPSVGFYIFW